MPTSIWRQVPRDFILHGPSADGQGISGDSQQRSQNVPHGSVFTAFKDRPSLSTAIEVLTRKERGGALGLKDAFSVLSWLVVTKGVDTKEAIDCHTRSGHSAAHKLCLHFKTSVSSGGKIVGGGMRHGTHRQGQFR